MDRSRRGIFQVSLREIVEGNEKNRVHICVYFFFMSNTNIKCGPGSSVGIATGYGLDGAGIESRWVARFSAPVQTGPGAHPASCKMGTGSFPGVNSGWSMTLTPSPLLVQWPRKSRAILLLPLWAVRPVQSLSACTRVHFTLLFTNIKYLKKVCWLPEG